MAPEQTRALLADPRVAPLVWILRDGTDEQVWAASVELCGTTDARGVWDQAMREAYPNTEDD